MSEPLQTFEQAMNMLRILAGPFVAQDAVHGAVHPDPLHEESWRTYLRSTPSVVMPDRSVLYHLVRSLYLIGCADAQMVPWGYVHPSYQRVWQLTEAVLAEYEQDQLRRVFQTPGAFERLVDALKGMACQSDVLLYPAHESERVAELLRRFLSLDPSRPNFEEQMEAWTEEVRNTVGDPLGPYLLSLAKMMLGVYRQEKGELRPPSPGESGDRLSLDVNSLMYLYDQIYTHFLKYVQLDGELQIVEIEEQIQAVDLVLAEISEQVGLFGMMDTGSAVFRSASVETKTKFMEMLSNPKIRDLIDRLGRMLQLRSGDGDGDPERSHDIVQSDRIDRLSGTGMATLIEDPDRFEIELANHGLSTYGEEPEKGQGGPFQLLMDLSGSMNEGNKDAFRGALTLRLAERAYQQQRIFACHAFAGTEASVQTVVIRPPDDTDRLIDMVAQVPHGGTNLEHPLRRGLKVAEQEAALRTSDMMIGTDGEVVVRPEFVTEFRQECKRLGIKVTGVLFNVSSAKVSRATLDLLCDQVVVLSDFTDESVAQLLSAF